MVSLFDFDDAPLSTDCSECVKATYKKGLEHGNRSDERIHPYHNDRSRKYSQYLTKQGIVHTAQWKEEKGGKECNIHGRNVDVYFVSKDGKEVVGEYKAVERSLGKNTENLMSNLFTLSAIHRSYGSGFFCDLVFCNYIPICKTEVDKEKHRKKHTITGFDTPKRFIEEYIRMQKRMEGKWKGIMPVFTLLNIFGIKDFDKDAWKGKDVEEFFDYLSSSELFMCDAYNGMSTDYLFINDEKRALDKMCEMMK